jgi:hypothetical protein
MFGMKNSLLIFLFFSGSLFAAPFTGAPTNQPFISYSKGDCVIENANRFAPQIESFKILLSLAGLPNEGDAFLYYNMTGTSAGLMMPARFKQTRLASGNVVQTVTGRILIGLVSGDQADVTLTIDGKGGKAGSISIAQAGVPIFSSSYSCK